MTKQWRNKTNRHLFTRPIYADEWPSLIEAMVEDGLIGILIGHKINWANNGYSLTAKAVREAWRLTDSQYRRLCDYVYSHDPFVYKE